MLQFSLTGDGGDEVVVRTVEDAEVQIAEAVATAIASVTGTIRASAEQGCEIDVDPVAQVRALTVRVASPNFVMTTLSWKERYCRTIDVMMGHVYGARLVAVLVVR